jgi:hypothetical protein
LQIGVAPVHAPGCAAVHWTHVFSALQTGVAPLQAAIWSVVHCTQTLVTVLQTAGAVHCSLEMHPDCPSMVAGGSSQL